MKTYIFILLCVVVAVFAACAGGESKPVDGSIKPEGATLFKTHCQTCHGANGKLGLHGAKDLTQSALSLEQRLDLVANGKGVMTPFRSILTPEEIRAVSEYTQTLK